MIKKFFSCGFLLFGSVGVMSWLLALVAMFLDLQCYARPLLGVCIVTMAVAMPMLAGYLLDRLWGKPMIDILFKVFSFAAGSTIGCGFTAILGLCVGYMDIAAVAGLVTGIMAVVAGLSYLGGCIAFRKKYGK